MGNSYKLGMQEIIGLEFAMREVFKPVQELIAESAYWTDSDSLVDTVEYKSRDGFIANKHNCGGLQIRIVVPKCEEYDWSFLNFGECDDCKPGDNGQCGYNGQECLSESEGHLDAALRIWFKFEGIEGDELKFMLYVGGGNGDAPYFRSHAETDIFEAEFTCKSVAGLKRAASKHIKALLERLS